MSTRYKKPKGSWQYKGRDEHGQSTLTYIPRETFMSKMMNRARGIISLLNSVYSSLELDIEMKEEKVVARDKSRFELAEAKRERKRARLQSKG